MPLCLRRLRFCLLHCFPQILSQKNYETNNVKLKEEINEICFVTHPACKVTYIQRFGFVCVGFASSSFVLFFKERNAKSKTLLKLYHLFSILDERPWVFCHLSNRIFSEQGLKMKHHQSNSGNTSVSAANNTIIHLNFNVLVFSSCLNNNIKQITHN